MWAAGRARGLASRAVRPAGRTGGANGRRLANFGAANLCQGARSARHARAGPYFALLLEERRPPASHKWPMPDVCVVWAREMSHLLIETGLQKGLQEAGCSGRVRARAAGQRSGRPHSARTAKRPLAPLRPGAGRPFRSLAWPVGPAAWPSLGPEKKVSRRHKARCKKVPTHLGVTARRARLLAGRPAG